MSELKRTILYQAHLDAGATMVDFGGWDMPIQYPEGIIAEHLYCRRHCGIFDVSHMGRIDVEGPDQVAFLQHVLSSNVLALDLNQAQYCIIPDENGYAIDDAYLYRFEEGKYFLVINAGNIDKDWAHLTKQAEKFDVKLTNVSDKYAAIAVQGPESKEMLMKLAGGKQLTPENVKNALNTLTMEGKPVRIAKTGYTGEPIGYELYCNSEDARYFWDRLIELGAKPTALGARDTTRMEAALPLYGHEMGECEMGGENELAFLHGDDHRIGKHPPHAHLIDIRKRRLDVSGHTRAAHGEQVVSKLKARGLHDLLRRVDRISLHLDAPDLEENRNAKYHCRDHRRHDEKLCAHTAAGAYRAALCRWTARRRAGSVRSFHSFLSPEEANRFRAFLQSTWSLLRIIHERRWNIYTFYGSAEIFQILLQIFIPARQMRKAKNLAFALRQ